MMEAASLCRRKRSCDGAMLQLHQEAQCQPTACKRNCREEKEVMKRSHREEEGEEEMNMRRRRRRTGSFKENRLPSDVLKRNLQRKTTVRMGSGFRSGEPSRSEVRLALIRKTRIQTSVRHLVQRRPLEILQDQRRLSEALQDQKRPSETLQNQKRSSETVLDQRKPSETLQNQKRAPETVQEQKRPSETLQDQRRPPDTLQNQKRPSETVQDQRKPPDTLQNQKRSSETVQGQKRSLDTLHDQRRPSETLQDQRRPTETLQDQRRQTVTVKDQRRPTETVEDQRRQTVTVKDQRRPTETVEDQRRPLETLQDHRRPSEIVQNKRRSSNGHTRIRRKVHPSAIRGRGQLRLSITTEARQLIIHIHEARGLMGKSHRSCDSYVKLAVTSDLSIRMKTPTVPNNKNPEYNHTFLLCVSDDIILGRLLVSVFRRRADSRCSQLIGCMSFGISSLVSSPELFSGCFYLLGEELGRSKHLRLTSQRSKPMRSVEEGRDLRRTPDSAPDTDLNRINTVTSSASAKTNMSTTTTTTTAAAAGLSDLSNRSLTSSHPTSLDPTNANYSADPTSGHYSSYTSTLYTNQRLAARDINSTQRLTVSIVRGQDGFGFTICSDSPVRVQAVDPGGPAHQSGLRQGDSVLQLNELPVETWKCVDLAHAIRRCPAQIVLVVWRGLPELRSGCEALPHAQTQTTGRKLLPHPAHSKHGRRRRGQSSGVRSSLGALGSLWRDRKEEDEDQELADSPPHTTTLKGTRVTSSNGDNYIILSPVDTGGQLLQPVYHDRNGTIGRLYQTHPSREQNLLHDPRPVSSRRPYTSHTATLPPNPTSTPSSSALPCNYGNYQNCTIVQSHLPCSNYGTYVTLAPKTLIFPVFVQPLDLCSPERTLLMSEEMFLHQADLLPAKVTVLIYTDLLLLTREDEAGRCNVLQSPLYLSSLQLREVASEPLHIYLLQSSHSCWRCLFSLEAFSIEQKVRVSLCLHDNIQQQLVATESGHSQQLSDFCLLSLHQSDLLYRPSSPYSSLCDPLRPPSPSPYAPSSSFSSSPPPPPPFSSLPPYASSSPPARTFSSTFSPQRSPVWKERGGREEEEEERQQGEGESASETSESVGGVGGRGLLLRPAQFIMKPEEESGKEEEEEEEGGGAVFSSSYRPAALRRSLSEGSLLQEPRSPRFLSDSTIHRLTRPAAFDHDDGPARRPPSPHTLRKQLTREGGSLHHMLLLFNGSKDSEFRNFQLKKKTKSLAADVRSRLTFLQRQKNSCNHSNSLEKALRNNRPSAGEVQRWAESLEALLNNQYGLAVFRHFLRSEFSEENLDFWLAVERFRRTRPHSKMAARAAKIYDEFISTTAARQVNVDSSVRELTNHSLRFCVGPALFQQAQQQVFGLMETDSYPRFLKSRLYAQLANQGTPTVPGPTNQSGAMSTEPSNQKTAGSVASP